MSNFKLILFLGSLASLAPFSMDMYLPALPVMHSEFDVETKLIQLTLTMTIIGMSIGQIIAGPISDHFGRKSPLKFGMLAFALSSFGCSLSPSIYPLLFFRLMQGLSGSFGIVIARAIARDTSQGVALTKLFAMLMLVNGLAPIIAPVIGGQVLLFATWRDIFTLLALIGLLLLIASFKFNETLPTNLRVSNMLSSFKNYSLLLNDSYFLGHCFMQGLFFASFFAYISGSSFLFQNIYQVSPQIYSAIFGGIGLIIFIIGTLPAKLAGKVKDIKMLAWSLIQSIFGSILFFICILFNADIKFTLIALVITVPTVPIFGATSFSLAMRTQGKMAGSASALIGFFSMIFGGLVAPLVGIAGSYNAFPMAIILFTGYFFAFIIFIKMIYSKHHRGYLFMKD